ncbi:MAG: ABC transporter permease [Myxococcales bacterium]|nr:ABC transporter permease [Myxococcales bacterium]
MRKILVIALNTFREAARNKVLYSLLFFAVVVIVGSLAFGSLSVRDERRLMLDLGLGGMSIFSVVIAIFIGVNLLYKELERKTVYTLIPKPIHRFQFVLGKFAGLVLTLVLQILVMALTLFVVVKLKEEHVGKALMMMTVLVFLEVLVVTAIAVLFSSFSTPFLSGFFTAGLFLLGRSVPDLRAVAGKLGGEQPVLATLLDSISRVVPNLRYFYVSGTEVSGQHVSVSGVFVDWTYVGSAALYALLYVSLLLILAVGLFSRRDFV